MPGFKKNLTPYGALERRTRKSGQFVQLVNAESKNNEARGWCNLSHLLFRKSNKSLYALRLVNEIILFCGNFKIYTYANHPECK